MFDRLGVFLFSREEGTPSHAMEGQVPAAVMEERRAELMEAQQAVHLARARAEVGREIEVLVEKVDPLRGEATGRSERDAPDVDGVVRLPGVRTARPGAFVRARVVAADGYDLVAEPLVAQPLVAQPLVTRPSGAAPPSGEPSRA
jgi:ribosomal protein S12 methylthiotransferase